MPMTMSEAGKLGGEKSRITSAINKQKRIDEYNLNPKHCAFCDSILNYQVVISKKTALRTGKIKNLFCSQSCAAKFNNQDRKIVNLCFCGQQRKNDKKYCSRKCGIVDKWKNKKEVIAIGSITVTRLTLRKFANERDGWKCSVCNITEWCGQKVPLVLDHIDGNSDNNLPNNIRLVCGNCDMQLPTYKGKNKGNGRYKRRQRYAEGKSY